jgi:hypothetical protein
MIIFREWWSTPARAEKGLSLTGYCLGTRGIAVESAGRGRRAENREATVLWRVDLELEQCFLWDRTATLQPQ